METDFSVKSPGDCKKSMENEDRLRNQVDLQIGSKRTDDLIRMA